MRRKAVKECKKRHQDGLKLSQDRPRKRLVGKVSRGQLEHGVKFKVEPPPIPNRPLGNRACCCRIGK
jgi:hypothetical protein